ncbi:MAG: zinc-binding dehydrogenase [Moorea sp. SIO3C2]|nr:zinc-binding dehydrogenase [Moorena sp. SIO3C2]
MLLSLFFGDHNYRVWAWLWVRCLSNTTSSLCPNRSGGCYTTFSDKRQDNSQKKAVLEGRGFKPIIFGKLKIHLSQRFPLKEAAAAHNAIEAGSMTGKVALLIN